MDVSHGEWAAAIARAVAAVDDAALAAAAGFILQAGSAITAGNGGSAALASHCAQAIMKPDYQTGGAARAAVCLTDGVPTLTAHANDGGWADALAAAAAPLLRAMPQAALVVFSSSGRSENVVRLARLAQAHHRTIIAFTGFDGEPLRSLATLSLHVDSHDYEVVEPAHDALMHRIQHHLRALG